VKQAYGSQPASERLPLFFEEHPGFLPPAFEIQDRGAIFRRLANVRATVIMSYRAFGKCRFIP